jgi:glycosyltransferase involved in cell wall biosynthesis
MRILLSFLLLCVCTGCRGREAKLSSQQPKLSLTTAKKTSRPATNTPKKSDGALSIKPMATVAPNVPAQAAAGTTPRPSSGGKKTICLNMIVKDEKPVITRCLASVKPIIDYWVIVDTGSTDGTQEVIREFMKDVPGELYERPWKNFEHNRNEALELAKGKGDYFLIMDADDYLQFDPTFKLPKMDLGSYRLWIKYGGTVYQRHQVIDMSLPWRWVGVLHEVLTCDAPSASEIMEGVKIIVGTDGARSRDPQKYAKDAEVLEAALKEEPDNTRYMFYLAQSHRDAGMYEKAIEWYLKRIAKGGWDEEVYWSMIQVGQMERALNRPDDVILDSFLNAYRRRPHRPEAVMNLAEVYRKQNRYDMAYTLLKLWQLMPKPEVRDVLFVQEWMEEYGLLFEFSISSYYVGQYQESLDACDQLLGMKNLPQGLRDQTIANRQFPLQKIEEQRQAAQASITEPEEQVG